ncbi:MAG: alpha/beta hydrolase [Gorillibacterium sp.]|nr:alpha/beta hydrolase [Gorillibacterium sp.]
MNPQRLGNRAAPIAYEEHGSGSPLILLHGFCGSSRYWEQIIPYLESAYRVVVPDLRGHGKSAAPEAAVYPMEAFASDIEHLITVLNIERPIVLGHSLGGYITLALAEKLGDQLAGFGLIHSTALPDTEEGRAGRDKGIAVINNEGIAAFVEGLIPKLFAPEHLTTQPEDVARMKEIGRGTSLHGAAAAQEGMKQRVDRNHVLEGAIQPVLLVAGAKDGVIPAERTFSVNKASFTNVTLASAGHMSMIETPEELAQVILTFCKRCSP